MSMLSLDMDLDLLVLPCGSDSINKTILRNKESGHVQIGYEV